ncbi:SMU1112c/YaeR family gloxylase I-like metalloprotein [Pediococcus pentosaceus]|uniref:SMU1112c/YaeR family gloxylase I-like metalloprotein n=1 Tax=Pediococcus pentosaceus TaxID=1255 RepID=UPI00223A9B21|nr:VOC family protein [Pediococcus pentosaceus]MCT1176573.1 VOC family protein [Pediococcus pentosaceus]
MEVRAVNHIAIICTDYVLAKEFYVHKLGMEVVAETERVDRNDVKLDLKYGDLMFEIFIKPDAPQRVSYPEAAGLRHISFATDNIEKDVDYLRSVGIKVEDIRRDKLNQQKMTFFFDPDGLPLELHE